jgi:arylsulfatase A-like enzyme
MKPFVAFLCLAPLALHAHTTDSSGLPMDKEMLRKHIADEFMAKRMALAKADYKPAAKPVVTMEVQVASMMTNLAMLAQGSTLTAPGNGELMSASFLPFKPKLRFYNDANYFYVESDGIPDRTRQPNLMVGITTWQQQVPMPVSYFIGTTNGTNNAGSLGFGQPNVWKLPLVPVPAAAPISLNGNFLRGAVALGSDGVPIFNPRNNTGQFSYDIGELDIYGGHCGLADDYHYHIYPVHLIPVLGNDKPIAWALDGYPVYGYVEPDGSPMHTLDADGGHDHGTWGYHYHARGTYNSGTASWTPTNPFMMNAMHGVVVNFDSQIDPQPNVSNMRASGTGGYTAQQVPGAAIIAFKNPVALSVDGSGHFIENVSGTPSEDDFLMRYTVSSVTYDVCWRLNRKAVPKSYTMTYRHPTTGTTTTTYTSNGNRITTYPMSGKSMIALPDTSQTGNFTGSAGDGEDSDYTIHAQAFTNNGNGTITDNVTGLMWQSVDNGETTWENAVANAASVTTGGYNDWRLPTPHELFCLFNHQVSNPALNTAFFPNHPVARAGYWWSSDLYGTSTTNVWCTNEGGGLGPKPKSETISAGGTLRYHARYVRGAKQTNGHNYVSNNDGTVTDLDTGLMWKQVPRTAATWSAALADIEGLTDAGFSDWRMPNVKEMESLVDYTMTTFTSLTNIKPPAHRLLFPSATATSYWTSTTQNNDALAALVVEFGLNTTSNPQRNAQGIISHEPKTSSYPVFAVRTAALTPTQIAVSQGATTLTDGLSTVGYGSVNVGGTLSKTFTITNNGSTALTGISLSIDGAHSSLFTVTTSPASSIAIGATSDFVVQFNASSAGAKTAALHITSSDSSVGAAFDIALTGTGAIAAPTITGITTTPTLPSDVDTPTVSATITPVSGATITSATLTYSTGAQTTSTIFNEPMSTTATTTGGWDGSGATYAWTVNSQDGAGNIKQTAGTSNHTTGITGSCGVVFSKGSAATTDPTRTMITTTNPINATGTFTSGSTTTNYVEFWVRTVGLTGTNGWSFQLAPNGTTFTERVSEFTASVHGYQLYHYDLQAGDLTSTLKMRFGFVGNGVGGPTGSTVNIDDIVVVTTSGSAPTPVTMSGPANGGSFTAVIPAQVSGTTITYSIAATDSNGQTTTITNASSYTTGPAPSITTGATLPNASGAYSQMLVASGGSGTGYAWSVNAGSTLPAGLTLSSAGVLSGTPTANGTFNFTLKVADSAGRIATRAFALTINGANVTPPNVVIIVTDDQGWGDVGYHTPAGQVPIQTPNMDSFATTGIRLERFYATTVCSVTRSTLMTGRNAIRHGTNNERGLDLSEHLMPQTFKAAGYQTFMCGKWHLGGSDKNNYHFNVNGSPVRVIKEGLQYAPHNRGWDSFYGQYSGAIDYYTHHSAEAESLDIPDWWLNGVQQDGPSEHTDSRGYGGWSPTLLADKAIAHIQNRNPAQPMLLHLAFNSIHGPVSAPASLITKYQNLGVTNANRRLISAAVDGMDQEIGRVLAALDTAGIANNTLVVWFGDNGGDETKGSLNDPLRGTKGDSYEGGMREVAGIKWPGVLPAGVISHQYMWVGDVFPTLCAAVGVTPQNTKPLDGVNLWPALLSASNSTTISRGSPLVTVSAAPIAIYQFTDPVNGGTKDFKLIRGRVNNVLTPELYNLTDDPQETTDLIANSAYASIVTTLTNAITAISVENMKPYVGPPLITNSVPQGGTITLYAPFTSWPGATPTVQWRKGGSNVAGGIVTQITDDLAVAVRGTYAATLTLTNVAPGDAGLYDVIVSNNIGSTTSDAGTLTVTMPAPALTLPAFTKGTSITLNWTPVPGATGYTIQRSTTSDFASVTSQTTSSASVTFSGLTSGTTYYYRGTATDGTATSAFGNTASSTQDASTPVITITAPANNTTTTANSIVVNGTASDTVSPLTGLMVNGVAATTSDGYATWTATVPLTPGANTITATSTDSADQGGNTGSASINVTYNANGPAIVSVGTGPTAPTYLDPTYVLAQITQQPGTTLTSVQLQYDTGTPVSTAIWKETFNNTSSNNWNGTGALNAWTTVGAGNVRQAVATSNRTAPVTLTSCETNGTTTVTCASTAGLWPGMLITGPNIAGSINGTQTGNTTVASITNATTLMLSQPATGSNTGLTLTAAGVTLTNCVTTGPTPGPASVTVTCDSTAGLINGMTLTGTGMANNATVASVTSATTFTMNAVATASGTVTLTATGAAAEFNGGTANLTDSMFTTTNAINTSGASGFIEFYVQTRDLFANNNCGWALQVSSDNGATWITRLFEDWNSETINLTNVVTNAAGATTGSTTVTCADTTGLTTGRSVAGPNLYITCGLSIGQSSVSCTDITGLLPGMALQGTGIPNNTRIGVITPGVSPAGSFTLVTGTAATAVNATVTNTTAAVAATYFPAATISSITNATTFVINTPAYVNTSAAPLATAFATTVNHGIQLFHYDLAGAELGTQTKIRFQATGYTPTAPTRSPRISIDDIVIATTAPPPTITLAMFDDGLHGDGAANDGVWGAVIPAQNGGTTINFKVVATDNTSASATSPGSGNYIYTVNNLLTDATILGAEFLTLPKTDGVTVNLIASANQQVFVEYGTAPGQYTLATTPTTFNIDNAKPEFKNPIRIPITGLLPDTEYYYRVRHRHVGAPFYNARGERSFHTARPRGTTFSFTVTADPHIDVNTDMQLFWRAMANISLDQPDIHMDVGDIFMTDKLSDGLLGVPPKWGGGVTINQTSINNRAIIFRNAFERACHSIPFFFGLGNHEAEYGYLFNAAADKQNNIPAWDLKARKAFYPAPTPDGFYAGNPTPKDYTGGTLGLLEDYYAFEWGEALFIMLDPFWNTMTNPNSSNDAWNWSLGKAQYDWLRDTLKNSSARYKFVFMHHIVGGSTQAIINNVPTQQFAARGGIEVSDKYEWGGNNIDGSPGFATKRPGWDMPIHDLLVMNKVNVVFHGHDHLYGYQTRDGVVYLECPQPGTPNYTSLGSAVDGQYVNLGANSTSYLLPNSGHIRVTVGPDQAVADYVRSYRTATDPMPPDATSVFNDETPTRINRSISHSFVLAPKVSPPIEVANVAPGQVGLRWNAIPNKPYQIQWSTDLVNWQTIETLTFTNTNTNATYTDNLPARVNGQRAFYRVMWNP